MFTSRRRPYAGTCSLSQDARRTGTELLPCNLKYICVEYCKQRGSWRRTPGCIFADALRCKPLRIYFATYDLRICCSRVLGGKHLTYHHPCWCTTLQSITCIVFYYLLNIPIGLNLNLAFEVFFVTGRGRKEHDISYKTALTNYFSNVINLNKNNPKFLFDTVKELTQKQPHKMNSSLTASNFLEFSISSLAELDKITQASKPTTCMLDPVPTKVFKELFPVGTAMVNIMNLSLSTGTVPPQFQVCLQ